MKIYILRHEDRTQDCSFFAPLTKEGLENSARLVGKLLKLNIDIVLSSPFIRTLQTIYPFVKDSKKKIGIEYGLSEMHHSDIIPKKAVGINLPEYLAETFSYDPEYNTFIKPTDIVYPETNKDVSVRIKRFLRQLIANYAGTEKIILLVTHQAVCSEILKIVNNSNPDIKLEESIINNYEKGRVSLVYSNGWTYQSP